MDLYNAVRQSFSNDEGVSPVIAVILMVAITVVLAATVYVWVSGFASEDTGPEQASATAKGLDTDDNGDVDVIRVTLTMGQNAPYTLDCDADPCTGAFNSTSDFLVSGTSAGGSAFNAASIYESSALSTVWGNGDTWNVGQALYLDCGGSGTADITVSVGPGGDKTAILDTTISCDE